MVFLVCTFKCLAPGDYNECSFLLVVFQALAERAVAALHNMGRPPPPQGKEKAAETASLKQQRDGALAAAAPADDSRRP